jgi:uncharacterized protein
MSLRFEWDPDRAATNERKHGVAFAEASTAFRDPHSLSVPDPDHSTAEARWLLLGVSTRGRLLVVAHTERRRHSHHQHPFSHAPRAQDL